MTWHAKFYLVKNKFSNYISVVNFAKKYAT